MAGIHGLDSREARKLHALYQRSRIERRHTCIGDYGRPWQEFDFFPRHPRLEPPPSTAMRMSRFRVDAADLAMDACRDLDRARGGHDLTTVDHLFVATCTGFSAPGLDVHIVRALGLRPDVGRTMIGFQGCQAGLTSLRLAENLCRSRSDATALVVCVELCTLHFQTEPTEENLLANALFADGAAAVLVMGADAHRRQTVAGHGASLPGAEIRLLGASTYLHAAGADEMVWSIGDAGFLLHLAPTIPDVLARAMPDLLPVMTRAQEGNPADWPIWAVHPGGAAILDRLESAFHLAGDRLAASREVLRQYGNMSSATIHFVLRRVLEDTSLAGRGVAMAFGPGISVEVVALEKVLP
jgi:predicted naringenin-chalcone synthase